MSSCTIIADHKSEERYHKLSLAYAGEEDHQRVESAIAQALPLCSLDPVIYAGDITEGKKMITIEYHDDIDRQGGEVFDRIIHLLGIEQCQ